MLPSSPLSAVLLVVKSPLVHDWLAKVDMHETQLKQNSLASLT